MRSLRMVLAVSAIALLAEPTAMRAGEKNELNWAEHVQVVYDAATRSVSRTKVRVVDPHPEKNLDFVWEPDAGSLPGVDPETQAASGKGRLVWRVRGSADYDPRTVFSTYEGEMREGRPNGPGRLEMRDGSVMEGMWKDGLLEGPGSHRDAKGNLYQGAFVAGLAEGHGRLALRDGSIYEGEFRAGKRHGAGTMRLAGGTTYESRWRDGVEVGGNRPDVLADARIGGLLKAQAAGGDAGRTEIAVVIDKRMTDQQEIQYQHLVRDQDVAIYPVSDFMNDAWNGTGTIGEDYGNYSMDWDHDHAYVQVDLQTTDNSRVRLDSMALDVATSVAYRKPMLTIQRHLGCVAFRPTFSFLNHGWGAVQNATLTVRFTNPELPREASQDYSVTLDDFDEGADVSLLGTLQGAGVDTDSLANRRFPCPSREQIGICRAQLFNSVSFGDIENFVYGEDLLSTTAEGEIAYEYADDSGAMNPAAEAFQVELMLALIETPRELAECGDGGFPPAEARRYQDIRLPVGQSDYSIDLPLRGNRNVKDYTARLKISSEMTSYHEFTASARFADGSVRQSKPVSLFYFKPRWPNFVSDVRLPACYLDEGFGSSC